MDILEALILGIVQGITEFLPISSSGHLVLAQALMGRELGQGVTFEVMVHAGSLVSILVYFRDRIGRLLAGMWRREAAELRMAGFILLSMVPAGAIGLTLEDQIGALFSNPVFVSAALLVTGGILWSTRYAPASGSGSMTAGKAFVVGLAQAFAILPGISRSGSTMSMGAWLGLKRDELADFSFLMVLPVIGGATLLKLRDVAETGLQAGESGQLVAGFLASAVSGYFALKALIAVFKKKGLDPFAWYCWIVGVLGLVAFG